VRLDKFLQLARLIKQRSKAKFMCDNGHVFVNGEQKKASYEIKIEDEIEVRDLVKSRKYRVLQIPSTRNVSKAQARELTLLLEEKKIDWV
jgi:ribosomal 50S subunit-recycling heat shock protein